MTEIPVVIDFLVRTLQQISPRPLTGTELSVLVRTAHPEFSAEALGFRNMRDFIRKRADEIAEIGRVGMDVQYCLKSSLITLGTEIAASSLADRALDQLMKDPRAWKTFTSPESQFHLYLTDQGIVRNLHINSKPLPEWRKIERISPEALLQIGRDFTSDLDEFQKSVLVPTLQEPKWWFPFFDRLQSLGLKYKWISFRRKRIADEFKRRIEQSGPLPLTQTQEPALPLSPQAMAAVSAQTQSELSIRKIAADVVQRMTESELRSLNLPLGYVVDSLTSR
jgi:hypothetical protein